MPTTPVRGLRQHGLLHDPVPGLVSIHQSVGAGGANARNDAQRVLIALNAVPCVHAGAGGDLAVDGLAGPKTRAAIHDFQARWLKVVDSRCDPHGPTLRLLNQMAGVFRPAGAARHPGPAAPASGFSPKVAAAPAALGPNDAKAVADAEGRHRRVYGEHLPRVADWMAGATAISGRAVRYATALRAAAGRAKPPTAADAPERRAFLFLAKYFRLHERDPAAALDAAASVDRVLRDIALTTTMQAMQPPPEKPGGLDRRIFVCLWKTARPQTRKDIGFTYAGGLWANDWKAPSGWVDDARTGDRRKHPQMLHQIFLQPRFDREAPDFQRAVLVHEMAHGAGPPAGGRRIDLAPEVYASDAGFAALPTARRLRTADCYAAFVLDLAIGTERAITTLESDSVRIPVYPRTDVITEMDGSRFVFLPPDGHPSAAQLAYPGGFL
ncbi:MAG: hypothetical protein ICV73_19115 [Acetobacteraceae bacterium]|nr:hypothetical protein [Acetobacteraceae bacterium]